MVRQAVSDAFEIVLEEIDGVAATLKKDADMLFSARDIKGCSQMNAEALEVLEFYHEVMKIAARWQNLSSIAKVPKNTPSKQVRRPRLGSRQPNKAIIVKFANGRMIKGPSAADTFAETLEVIGLEKVRALGKSRNGFPLVGTQASENYTQREVGGFFVMTHTSSEYKKEVLEEIALELGAKLTVELV